LSGLNPDINFVAHRILLDAENVEEVICKYDLVIDGTDNFSTRFLLGDACYLQKIALLHGAIHQYQAQIVLFNRNTGCFRCLYREPPGSAALPNCSEAGILNVVTGATGLLMASEAIKYLAGLSAPSLGSVLVYEALQQSIRCLKLKKETDCPLCGEAPSIRSVSSSLAACSPLRNFYVGEELEVSVERAKRLLEDGALLIDVRTPEEFARDRLAGAISMPLDKLENGASDRLARNQTVVTYCQSGVRSLAAANKLRSFGYTDIYSVAGGIVAWNQFAARTV
jgi:sulfur-carrier protein adenylyltransferase/sulfurtransferase